MARKRYSTEQIIQMILAAKQSNPVSRDSGGRI